MSVNSFTKHEPLIFKTGSNIKLIHRAEYCKSIIADGKELITGNESGEIRVPELKDEKVYITFKDDVTDLSYAFFDCTVTSIPENLFANCPKATDFSGTFNGCTALIEIPEQLFANNPEVTSFYDTFFGCRALISIPENLFAKNPNVTDFTYTFALCKSLKYIQKNLFANNPKVTIFQRTFWKCSALKSIPENLFANNPKVTTFQGTFSACDALAAIPENLFANRGHRLHPHLLWLFGFDGYSGELVCE